MNRRERGAWILVGLIGLGLGASTVHRARLRADGGRERSDLPVYLAGAERVARGEDPLGAASGRGWTYLYPATLAVLVQPLRPLPPLWAAGVWYALSALALGWGILATRRALGGEGPLDRWELLALAGLVLPSASALLRGQVGPLLLGLLGVALHDLRRGRDLRAGLLISLAAAIKLTPGVLLPGLVAGRRWRALLAALGGLLLWLLLVPAPFLGFVGAARSSVGFAQALVLAPARDPQGFVLPGRAPVDPHIATNQSLASQVIRRTDPGPPRAALLGALALLLAPALWLCARAAPEAGAETGAASPRRGEATSLGLLLAWTLVAAPIAWHHYHPLLAPVLLGLAGPAAQGVRLARAGLAGFLALSLLHFAVGPLRPWGLLGYGTLLAGAALALYTARPDTGEKKS